jgi:hypothetical protein
VSLQRARCALHGIVKVNPEMDPPRHTCGRAVELIEPAEPLNDLVQQAEGVTTNVVVTATWPPHMTGTQFSMDTSSSAPSTEVEQSEDPPASVADALAGKERIALPLWSSSREFMDVSRRLVVDLESEIARRRDSMRQANVQMLELKERIAVDSARIAEVIQGMSAINRLLERFVLEEAEGAIALVALPSVALGAPTRVDPLPGAEPTQSSEAQSGWSRKHDACRDCGGTFNKHAARGYCTVCYPKHRDETEDQTAADDQMAAPVRLTLRPHR